MTSSFIVHFIIPIQLAIIHIHQYFIMYSSFIGECTEIHNKNYNHVYYVCYIKVLRSKGILGRHPQTLHVMDKPCLWTLHGSPQIEVWPEGKARFQQFEHKFLNSHIGLMFETSSYLKLNNYNGYLHASKLRLWHK